MVMGLDNSGAHVAASCKSYHMTDPKNQQWRAPERRGRLASGFHRRQPLNLNLNHFLSDCRLSLLESFFSKDSAPCSARTFSMTASFRDIRGSVYQMDVMRALGTAGSVNQHKTLAFLHNAIGVR